MLVARGYNFACVKKRSNCTTVPRLLSMIVVEVSHEGQEVPKNESDCFLWFTIRKKSFRKTWLESKWNTAFWVNPAENFLEKRNI